MDPETEAIANSNPLEVELGAGGLLRHSVGARISMQMPRRSPTRRPPIVWLEQGCTWHQITGPGDAPYSVRTSSVLASARAATFMVTAERDASCFVVVLDGTVDVTLREEEPAVTLGSAQAVACYPGSGLTPVIEVSPNELSGDEWVAQNLRLDDARFKALSSVRGPGRAAMRVLAGAAASVLLGLAIVFAPFADDRSITLIEDRQPALIEPTTTSGAPVAEVSDHPTTSAPPTSITVVPVPAPSAPVLEAPVLEAPGPDPPTSPQPPAPDPSAPAFTTSLRTCKASSTGSISFSGVVTNLDLEPRRYRLRLRISDGTGSSRYQTELDVVAPPQEEATWRVESPPLANRAGGRCNLDSVEVLPA
jgi:hypothetical protein